MSDAGASPAEQLLEASRRNNTDLFDSLLAEFKDPQMLIDLINNTTDPTGNSALHLCCKYGNYEVMDKILDIDGVNVDPICKFNGNTPLHYAASLSFQEPDYALFLVNELINCGANPSIKNKDGEKPIDIIGKSNEQIRNALESAEYASAMDQPIEDIPDFDDDDDDDDDDDEPSDDEDEDADENNENDKEDTDKK